MFKDTQIRRNLSQLLREYRIPNEYNLGIYFDDDGSHSDHRVLYLWLEDLLDESPNLSFEDINLAFRKIVPEFLFS